MRRCVRRKGRKEVRGVSDLARVDRAQKHARDCQYSWNVTRGKPARAERERCARRDGCSIQC